MAKTKKEKEKIVDELAKNLKKSKSLLFTTYIGLAVSKISKLRKLLKEKGHKYEVVKKTLIKKGFEKAGIKDFKIASANGLVIGFDEIEPIKLVYNFIKENPELQVESGLVGNKFMTKNEIEAFSKLPDRNSLLAQIVFTIKSPLMRLGNALQYNLKRLLYTLSAIK